MTGTGGKNEDSQAGFQKQWKKTKEELAFAVAAGMLVHYQHLLDFAPENVRQ